jgi:hypothetical protein
MNETAIDNVMSTRDKVQLKLNRKDLIDQLIHEVERENRRLIEEAREEARGLKAELMEMIKESAKKRAKPAMTVLMRMDPQLQDDDWRASFDYSDLFPDTEDFDDVGDGDAAILSSVNVRIQNGSRWNGVAHFSVNVAVPAKARKLIERIQAARSRVNALRSELHVHQRDKRSAATRSLIGQSIENCPEAKAAMEALRILTAQIEKRTGKRLLSLAGEGSRG